MRHCVAYGLVALVLGLLLVGCGAERSSPPLAGGSNAIATTTPVLALVPTYTPPPALLSADFGVTSPPVVYLAAQEIHHLLNACQVPNPYGGYFWRREWVPDQYPYTDQPGGGAYDAENNIIPMPWLEPQGFGGEFHPFAEARKALGDRLSPLWVGTYVNDPGLSGPIQDLVCGESLTFHDAWTGRSNHSRGRSVRWLGHITVPAREPIVHLRIRSGAGIRMFIGSELVVDAIAHTAGWDWYGQHALTPGVHILRLEYVERHGPVQVTLDWSYGSGEHVRRGHTVRVVELRSGPGEHYPAWATLEAGTTLWLESWVPEQRSQYWLGSAGVPAWWQTWWQGQRHWLPAEAVEVTDRMDRGTFLAHWEEQHDTAPREPPTDLCQRSTPAQYLILKSLTRGWHELLTCSQVTPAQLAPLVHLEGTLDYGTQAPQAGDLDGLSSLAAIQIRIGSRPLPPAFLPPGTYQRIRLLATQPQVLAQDGWAASVMVDRLLIQSSDWSGPDERQVVGEYLLEGILREVLPPELFQGMRIRHLHLNLPAAASLPANLLTQLQGLQQLQLRLRVPFESLKNRTGHPLMIHPTLLDEPLPVQLLHVLPDLEVLHFDVPRRRLPNALLTSLAHLKVLRLRGDLQQVLQLDKTALRQLEILEILDTNVAPDHLQSGFPEDPYEKPLPVPAAWLEDLPLLRVLRINSKRIQYVPPNWLAPAPHLEVVELGGSNWVSLSHLCLAGIPKLRHLHLNWSAPLIAHGNNAWRLDQYDSSILEPIQDQPCQTWAELAKLPYFHRNRDFQAAARDAPTVFWPSRPERQWEQVTHRHEVDATMRLRFGTSLPAAILSDLSLRPTVLHLADPELKTLTDSFPGQVDQLRTLRLDLPELTALPETFLEPAHQLRTLHLDLPELTTLPETFLEHLPTIAIAGAPKYSRYFSKWYYWMYPEHRFYPSLTLSLNSPQLTGLPDHLLNGPGVNLESRSGYSAAAFSHSVGPRYTYIELVLDRHLPSHAVHLTNEPGLTHLTLELPQLTALPAGILAQASSLTHLTLELPQLTTLPAGILAQASSLTHLTLELPQLTTLPAGILAQASSLTHLTLELPQLTALPGDFWRKLPVLRISRWSCPS